MGLLSLRRSVAESGLLPVRTALCVLLSSARAWFVSSQKLHRRDRVYAVIYGCRHTRAMCGGCFADGGAPPRVTPWSARLLATATGVSGHRVDPAPWAIAGRPRYVAPRKADRFEVSAGPHECIGAKSGDRPDPSRVDAADRTRRSRSRATTSCAGTNDLFMRLCDAPSGLTVELRSSPSQIPIGAAGMSTKPSIGRWRLDIRRQHQRGG